MQLILTATQIEQKLVRIAHQIIESTYGIKTCYLGGIAGNGFSLAQELGKLIEKYDGTSKVVVFEIKVNKEKPWSEEILLSIDEKQLKNGYILLMDDVLNSGKTMQYTLVKFLQQATTAIKTVAIVDRKHRRYPIKADFVGLSLSTTIKERVVITSNKKNEYEAYLK